MADTDNVTINLIIYVSFDFCISLLSRGLRQASMNDVTCLMFAHYHLGGSGWSCCGNESDSAPWLDSVLGKSKEGVVGAQVTSILS